MIAYKASYNFKCKHITYEIGKTYTFKGEIKLCSRGFHFCKLPDDVFEYYDYNNDFVLLEIEILGKVIDKGNKSVTDKFKVLREVPKSEYKDIFKNNKFDKKGNRIYSTCLNNNWEKWEYDENNNQIYYENSRGVWTKYEYDENNKLNTIKNHKGYTIRLTYDKDNKYVFFCLGKNCLKELKYDDRGNLIYYNSYRYWEITEYDEKNRVTFFETKYGYQEYKYEENKIICILNKFEQYEIIIEGEIK